MKKPHKPKARKAAAKRTCAPNAQAPLVAHSTRRQPHRPDTRRAPPPRRTEPATIYRRVSPVAIESSSDKRAFRLLLLPFVAMALILAVVPALHVYPTLREVIAATPPIPVQARAPAVEIANVAPDYATSRTAPIRRQAVVSPPRPIAPATGERAVARASDATPQIFAEFNQPSSRAPAVKLTPPTPIRRVLARPEPGRLVEAESLAHATIAVPNAAEARQSAELRATEMPMTATQQAAASLVQLTHREEQVAMLATPSSPRLLIPIPAEDPDRTCPVVYGSAASEPEMADDTGQPFGVRLARAAAAQTQRFVIYDDKYRPISRAGGDVPGLYGVCTDVVIRAYRSIGIDLQVLVQAARVGAGDPNIDHRRTETLRRYLARFGHDLPVSPFGEDYEPGDIVTYWRPQNSGSRSHIALVAAERGPSGNLMIIHNRGWGPQLEDALFVDRITGHYRYDGASRPVLPPQLAATRTNPFPAPAAATSVNLTAAQSPTRPQANDF